MKNLIAFLTLITLTMVSDRPAHAGGPCANGKGGASIYGAQQRFNSTYPPMYQAYPPYGFSTGSSYTCPNAPGYPYQNPGWPYLGAYGNVGRQIPLFTANPITNIATTSTPRESATDRVKTYAGPETAHREYVDDIASPSDRVAEIRRPPATIDKTIDSTTPSPASAAFLVGLWEAVARTESGELTTVQLKLDENGWATLSVPTASGERAKVERRFELKDGHLLLTGANSQLDLGKLASFAEDQVVLERPDGQVTFVRP